MMRSQTSHKNGKYAHSLLAVYCGKKKSPEDVSSIKASKPSPVSTDKGINLNDNADSRAESSLNSTGTRPAKLYSDLITAGQLEVHFLETPTRAEFTQSFEALEPEVVYFLGEPVAGSEDIGPFELADAQISTPDAVTSLFGEKLPQLVSLETSASAKLGDALRNKGVPFVVYWKGPLYASWASHFRQSFVAILRSPSCQVWNACQFAIASFRFYRGIWKSQGQVDGSSRSSNLTPVLLGDAPENVLEAPKIKDSVEGDGSPSMLLKVQICDAETDLPLLVVAEAHGQENSVFGALEDGLNTALMVEVRGMRLLHRVSAPSPPASIPPLARGVITMRCDLCTSSSARISLLVAGSAQTCFDDQMLEYSIKKELLENSRYVSSPPKNDKRPVTDVRKSASIACGSNVMEVKFRTSCWTLQVLRQLAPELSLRSLVSLGVAGIQGYPVAAFQKEDADRFLALRFFSSKKNINEKHENQSNGDRGSHIPSWLVPPVPSRKRQRIDVIINSMNKHYNDEETGSPSRSSRNNSLEACFYVAAMKPVPHVHANREMPYSGAVLAGAHNAWSMKVNLPNGSGGRMPRSSSTPGGPSGGSGIPASHRGQNIRVPSPAQMLSLNPVPLKKHGCNRPPMHECSEDEFRKDVMQFLISRGHGRLVPSTDVETFPDAVLNGKRLDLYNLYKEVVSRGGFHVGNGINWKGQVFAKMRNHTVLNKMTGVGNTLKKHYETYLLEYELAHEDVDGECCILCHSSAAGDWVNCGMCGEWAHYGCDKRNGLGAFKEYAKTDGLEYICPRCGSSSGRSASGRKKSKTSANGLSRT